MRVSSNNQSQVEFRPTGAITKPIRVTGEDLPITTSSVTEPKTSKFNLKDLSGSDFASALKANLKPDAMNQVHEEKLQAGVVKSILDQANPKAADIFSSALDSATASGLGTEDAVKTSLKSLVQEGYLTQGDANLINGISFKAAQLDSNLEALYDDRGSASDATIAVDSLDNAILKASEIIGALQVEDTSKLGRSLDIPSNSVQASSVASEQSTTLSGSEASSVISSQGASRAGFLWKPISESNGNLVVLMPKSLTNKVDAVSVYAGPPESGATPLDKGRFTGNANGDRGHFRFSKPGSGYPDGAFVVAQLKDGSVQSFQIGDSSSRNS